MDVAHAIYHGRPRGKDGPKPKCKAKLDADAARIKAIRKLTETLEPLVEAEIGRRTMCQRSLGIDPFLIIQN